MGSVNKNVMVSESRLREICETLLAKVGVLEGDKKIISDSIIEANLRGIDTHGIAILPTYLKRIEKGATNPVPHVTVEREGTAFSLFNGNNGLGAVVANEAVLKAVKEAQSKGAYVSFCKNTNTYGPASYYSSLAANMGMICITMCNAPASMSPWGGKKLMIGTNPISIAVPVEGENPIVLDMATSAAAKSKIYLALDKGGKIPLGWALDKDGKPTTEPTEALKGFLLPLGGHKGYGLALMIDILAGLLSGSGSLDEVGSLHNQMEKGQNVGFIFLVINPDLVAGKQEFKNRIHELVRKIQTCPPAEGTECVLLPGEIEYRTKENRREKGIPVPENVMNQLYELLEK
jgi:LDH2 family malate/lactate/ureidoglycolate dehydrogenase